MRDYTKIEAWRLADDLTIAVYERTRMVGSAVAWLVQTQQIGPSNLDDSINLSLPDVIADRLAFAPAERKSKRATR
jgi:hypothetical protein